MSLIEIETFVRVAELGTLSGAARKLDVPTSTVSRRVSRLEEELGEALLVRTARSLQLTDAGRAVYERCSSPLREIEEVARAVRDHDAEPAGELRITAPSDMGVTQQFVALLESFRAAHPRVLLAVELTDRVVDLAAERVDLAFRIHGAPLPDRTSLVARRLATLTGGLYASEAYLEANGTPETLADLQAHRWVGNTRMGRTVHLLGPDGDVRIETTPVLLANDLNFVRTAVAAGVGIGVLPDLFTGPGLRRVLPELTTAGRTLSLVWIGGRALSPRVRRFVEHTVVVLQGTACTRHR